MSVVTLEPVAQQLDRSSDKNLPDSENRMVFEKHKMGTNSVSEKRKNKKWEELVKSLSRSYNEKVSQALQQHEYNFVMTDPRLPDHPIVYASEGFCKMSGYKHDEVLGRNCRFLQGPDTDRRTVLEIRDAIREERPCQVRILNYTKQGDSFWNLFHLAPVYSGEDGRVIHFVGVQTPIQSNLATTSAAAVMSDLTKEATTVTEQVNAVLREQVADLTEPGSVHEAGSRVEKDLNAASEDNDDIEGSNSGPKVEEGAVDVHLVGGAEEEDISTVNEQDKLKAATAVGSVMCELTGCSKIKGALVQHRRVGLSESAAGGVVCSSLMISLTRIQQSFVLADPNLPDLPIVHASDVFCELSGYKREEVVGRNCRFMQGPDTDPTAVQQIREAIEGERACTVRILNYRKDKTPFWNHLHVAPVRSAQGKVAFYVGVQLDVTAADVGRDQEKGMSPYAKQLGAVGVVRVAVRSLQGSGLRRTLKKL